MFSKLIGNELAKETLKQLLASGRVPGSLLFTGEAGIGKKLFALELAKALTCRNRRDLEACDVCSSCKRIGNSTFPPFGKDDDDKNRLIWSEHTDVAMARPYRQIIRVPVMRELEREANFRPFEAPVRIFIVEDADFMNENAANALLKTLEEPSATTHLILTTTNPMALPATIRSRCQVIRFAPIAAGEIEEFLIHERSMPAPDAALLARISRGSLGIALASEIDEYRQQRQAMLNILTSLAITGDRVQLLRAAEALAAAKDRAAYEHSLEILEGLIRDSWALSLGRPADTIVNLDISGELMKVAADLSSRRAASWLVQIEELRGALEVNLNKKIASDGLVLAMAAA